MEKLDRSGIWFIIVLLVAASFPWHMHLSTIGIILLVMHWLWDRNLFFKLKSIQFKNDLLLFWLFFVAHIIGIIGSDYFSEGLHSIEVKLSFLILPLLFSTENYLNTSRRKVLEWTFIISCVLSLLFCIGITIFRYPNNIIANLTHRMVLSESLMHPGYYSNFLAFSVAMLATNFSEKKIKNINVQWISILLIIFLLTGLVFLASKTAFLFIGLVIFYFLWNISAFIKNTFLRVASFVLVFFMFSAALFNIPVLKNRALETFQRPNTILPNELKFYNSTGSRMAAWGLCWEIVNEKPVFGHGTGAANPLLLQKFKQYGYKDLVHYSMHTHNQLLHTWIDLGAIGVMLLLTWFGVVLYLFIAVLKDVKGIWIVLLTFINVLTDDMLEIQAGIVFFIFFITLYLYLNREYKRPHRYKY